jgi:aerobic-type carbon monoxide dehydrogenase small subunit (CoxS/CutS family)
MSDGLHLVVNGRPVSLHSEGSTPLLFVLRNELGLRGSRFGCGTEQCGACMVLIDDEAAFSCARPVHSLAGREVTTVEGLAREDGHLHPLQEAILAEQAGQCGYCLSGIVISAAALLRKNHSPSETEIKLALDRNLCRCGVHNRIVRAVQRAGAMIEAAART